MLVNGVQAAPIFVVAIVLTLVAATLLLNQKQRQRPDFVGRVKSDAYLAMLRALLLLLIGLLLALAIALAGLPPLAETLQKVALAPIAIGAVAFLARLALYTLRIRPQLDALESSSRGVEQSKHLWADEPVETACSRWSMDDRLSRND